MKALEKARKRARKAIESMYEARCTVTEYGQIEDPATHITEEKKLRYTKACPVGYLIPRSLRLENHGRRIR